MRVVTSRRRNLPLATLHWAILESLHALGLPPKRYPINAEIDAMARADLVVDLSGDMLTEDYGALVGYSHFLPLLQAQALGRPVLVCAQSVGPFRRLAPMARRIFRRARLIAVRESLSPPLLAALDDAGIQPVQTADLAFMLQPAPEERIAAILTQEGVPEAPGLRLGVSVSALLANKTNRHVGGAGSDKLSAFARALDHLVESLGIDVLLVPHVFGPRPSGDDRAVGEQLARLMRHPINRLEREYRPEEIKGVIARCDAFVGCRMHANIAALDSGVPVLAIGYSHKTRGILHDLGLDDWVLSSQAIEADALIDRIESLFAAASGYRSQLSARLPEMRRRSRETIDSVARILETDLPDPAA
jgi:colanic acid/amylovoran biosynthesis protein